ncbi:hypothetical protein HYE67_004175 [Fusarium culmorum]|uniref:Oxidoreductase acuF-like C2H2 type zinc-finger domain-containing protein n=1 Tax=Fusarium culmorum TaxID=5516 RepID=A0A7S8HVH1_FUSCU|nr:hypothetical protein HYE67_004175 [Fusarium culmorum]
MENIAEKQSYDPALKVQLFLDALAALGERPVEEGSLIARLCSSLIIVFGDTIQNLGSTKVSKQDRPSASLSLQRSFDRLRLWSDNYGICAGEQDTNFSKSRRLRHATTEILTSISDTVLERLEPMTSSKKNEVSNTAGESTRKLQDILEAAHSALDHDASSLDSGSDYGPDSLIEIAKDLETDTMCLMSLDTLFQSVEMEPFVEKIAFADEAQSWLPHDIYKDKIQTRFPRAESSLILRLSKTAYHRYLRCQKERRNQTAEVGNIDFIPPARSEGSSSKFHDSGLGTSIPSSASVAETVMSYHAEGGNPIRIPPLPKEAKEGQPFECVSCGKLLSIRNNSDWKRHLYKDLLPWQCLYPDCSFTAVFESREDWVAHISDDHKLGPNWRPIICPLCLDTTAPGKMPITKHLCNHLEEISLAALPVNLDLESNAGSEDDSASSGSQVESTSEKNDPVDPDKPVLQNGLDYVEKVRVAFLDRPHVYRRFLEIMSDYASKVFRLDLKGVVHEVRDLFAGTNHEDLSSIMVGFSRFLPSGYFLDGDFNLRFPDDTTTPDELGTSKIRLTEGGAISVDDLDSPVSLESLSSASDGSDIDSGFNLRFPDHVGSQDELDTSEIRPTGGDAILVAYLNNGRDPEIARAAGESLPPDDASISNKKLNLLKLFLWNSRSDCQATGSFSWTKLYLV